MEASGHMLPTSRVQKLISREVMSRTLRCLRTTLALGAAFSLIEGLRISYSCR